MTTMTSQAVDVAIDTACRTLRLPTIRDRATQAAQVAVREQHSYQAFLAELWTVPALVEGGAYSAGS